MTQTSQRTLFTPVSKREGRVKGIILAYAVIIITLSSAYLFVAISKRINPLLGMLALIYLSYSCLAIKDLRIKAMSIYEALRNENISLARKELSKIVGRETSQMDKRKITIAAIESVAENTSDGIIAPLFYLVLGGPLLALGYKAISTLDSMVGYKNQQYIELGWFSAKLDDIANYIPSRLSALLITASAFLLKKDSKQSLRVMLRDHKNHASPNSGFPESAMSGALGIRLGGPAVYKTKTADKPFIGEDINPVTPELIITALDISLISSFLMLLIGLGIKWII